MKFENPWSSSKEEKNKKAKLAAAAVAGFALGTAASHEISNVNNDYEDGSPSGHISDVSGVENLTPLQVELSPAQRYVDPQVEEAQINPIATETVTEGTERITINPEGTQKITINPVNPKGPSGGRIDPQGTEKIRIDPVGTERIQIDPVGSERKRIDPVGRNIIRIDPINPRSQADVE